MWISDTSIKRPVFATMVIVSFMVLGIVSLGRLGIDLFPEVNFPFVNISVVYPGAGPEEVETLVTRPIEDAVAGINGVKRVISTSTEGFSRVGIELRLEIDPQAATAEVREKVAAIRERLPEQIKDPTIQRFDVSALPISTYAVGSSSLPSDRIRRMVEDDLKPLLGQIDGVAAVEVNGGEVRELQVNLDPRRLEALNLPITDVAAKLAADNLDVPGGQVRRDGKAVSLRTQGQYKSAAEIENVILRSDGGSTVRVKDVGEVVDGFEDRVSTTRLDGADAVSFSVRKQSGANTVDVQHKIDAALAKAAPSFPQLQIKTVHTDAEGIIENVEDVRMNIIFGGIMAVLVVFVFMRDWRSTLITALALPTSVIATFFFMYAVGFTINMMTLMALSLVIGILIDDAVVVRESIYRHMEHGEDPVTAARNGTSEIGLAVMATTFTILAVFLPVGFMTGIVGQFFKSFALTIAFAVSISLLVAFTLDPMLSSRFVRFIPLEERTRTRMGRFMERVGHFYDRIDVQYHKLLGWAVEHPWKIIATAAVVFVASLSTLTVIGTEFVPAEDRGEFVVNIEAPPGTAFEQTVAHVVEVEKVVKSMPEVRQIFSTVGFEGSPLKASLRVKAGKKFERERGLEELKEDMRVRLKQIPLLKMTVADPEFMQGSPTQAPLSVYLRGDDMVELQRLNEEVVARVKAVPGAVDVDSTLETGQPEMAASVNRELAADLGFDVGSVAMQLRGMVEGIVPTRLREDDKEYDIRVRLAPEFRNDFESIARTPLYSPTGAVVRARDIVRLQPEVGPAAIEREQRRRQAKINIELSDRPLGDVTADVDKVMQAVTMPPNFEWGFAGDVEMMQEAGAAMGLALVLAMAFIYIVLASQFESFLEPFLIMTSLPLALVGALLALLLTGRNIGMPAMIGVVMLMGLVTKNAILLVDLTNQYVREGLSVKDAILKAGPVRLRPIMMTTIAMILGMLPSAVGTGEGSGFRSPIAIATIGGLITSTLLTLVVVPVCVPAAGARAGSRESAPFGAGARAAGGPRRGCRAARRADGLAPVDHERVRLRLRSRTNGRATARPRRSGRWPRRRANESCRAEANTGDVVDVRPGAAAGTVGERGPEGLTGEGRRNPGARAGGEDQFPAASEPGLLVHADTALPDDPRPRGNLRARRADIPGGVCAREQRAVVHQPADLHRGPAAQRLRHHELVARRLETGARANAPGDRIPRRRNLLRGPDEPARGGGGRRADSTLGEAARAGEGAVRVGHGGAIGRPAGGSRAGQREGPPHPDQGAGRRVDAGAAQRPRACLRRRRCN